MPGASSSSHQHQRHDQEDLHHYRDHHMLGAQHVDPTLLGGEQPREGQHQLHCARRSRPCCSHNQVDFQKCARMICQLTSYENHWLRVSKISTDTIALVWSRPHNGGALIQGACLEDGDHGDRDDDGDHRDNDDLGQRPFYILHLFYEKSCENLWLVSTSLAISCQQNDCRLHQNVLPSPFLFRIGLLSNKSS